MTDINSAPGRHRRQRSSVTIKKRVSHTPLHDKQYDDGYEVPDNSLSQPDLGLGLEERRSGEDVSTVGESLLFRPTNAAPSEPVVRTMEVHTSPNANAIDQREQPGPTDNTLADGNTGEGSVRDHGRSHSGQSEQYQLRDATTRTEIDLFEEEDSSSGLSSTSAPVSSSEGLASDIVPLDAQPAGIEPSQVASPSSMTTPKMRTLEFAGSDNTPGARARGVQAKGGLMISTERIAPLGSSSTSPRTSPRALRMQPGYSQSQTGTPRSARRGKRMSLGYFSNAENALSSPIVPNTGYPMTPPITSSSAGSHTARGTAGGTPRSASISTTASVESAPKTVMLSEGETLLSQDKGILERIAEKERGILELKESLAKEERELTKLKREWQRSAQQKLAGGVAQPSEKSWIRAETETGSHSKTQNTVQPSAVGTADTLKGLSARLQSNFGSQINAILDQLVPISPHLDQDKPLTDDAQPGSGAANQPLGALQEEEELEGALIKDRSQKTAYAAPSATARKPMQGVSANGAQHEKRTSVFASSFAAFQKQMEKQLNTSLGGEEAMGSDKAADMENGNDSSWSSWQKRLREARDNASDFLAKAEARIGQVMTLDDLVKLERPESEAAKASMSRSGSANAFEAENDRERAALAELSWMNSLAGLKTIGTVDRVVTTAVSPQIDNGPQSDADLKGQADLTASRRRGEIALNLSSRSSDSSSSQVTSHGDRIRSPQTGSMPLSVSKTDKSRRTSMTNREAEKGNGNTGFLDALSTVWASAVEISPPTSTKQLSPTMNRDKMLSGQSRTRAAVQAIVGQQQQSSGKASSTTAAGHAPDKGMEQRKSTSPDASSKADHDWSW